MPAFEFDGFRRRALVAVPISQCGKYPRARVHGSSRRIVVMRPVTLMALASLLVFSSGAAFAQSTNKDSMSNGHSDSMSSDHMTGGSSASGTMSSGHSGSMSDSHSSDAMSSGHSSDAMSNGHATDSMSSGHSKDSMSSQPH
jgi:hypothetical protein